MCYILPQSVVFPMDYSTIRLILIASYDMQLGFVLALVGFHF